MFRAFVIFCVDFTLPIRLRISLRLAIGLVSFGRSRRAGLDSSVYGKGDSDPADVCVVLSLGGARQSRTDKGQGHVGMLSYGPVDHTGPIDPFGQTALIDER